MLNRLRQQRTTPDILNMARQIAYPVALID
jgi:hypothetical protein